MNTEYPDNIDTTIYVGHWPFHKIPQASASEVLRSLLKSNTETAIISPLNSIFYKDPQEGYKELRQILQREHYQCKILFSPVINPMLPWWEKEYEEYCRQPQVVALRLFPGYHGYSINGSEFMKLAECAARDEMPLLITIRLQDARIRNRLDMSTDVPLDDIISFIELNPGARVCFSHANRLEVEQGLSATANENLIYFDTAAAINDYFYEKLVGNGQLHRVLYGSARPFMDSMCSQMPLVHSGISMHNQGCVFHDNARDFYRNRL